MKFILASLLIPGLGQILQRRPVWALGFFVLAGLLFVAGMGLFGNLLAAAHAAWLHSKGSRPPLASPSPAIAPGAIINLTQHAATPDQAAAGVVEIKGIDAVSAKELLTFKQLPTPEAVSAAAAALADLAVRSGAKRAMIGGAPFLMGPLESALKARGVQPLYAFSRRESVDHPLPDGSIRKVAIFRHEGFVPA